MSGPRLSIIPAGAVLDPRLKARDLQVLCVFGKHTDRNGWCCRSQVKMAREMGCARSTVQAAIKRLVEAGWLEVRMLSTPHEDGERDSAHEYRVVLDQPDDTQDVVPTLADLSAPPCRPVGTPADSGSAPPADSGSAPPADSGSAPKNDPFLTTPSKTKSAQARGSNLDLEKGEAARPSPYKPKFLRDWEAAKARALQAMPGSAPVLERANE